MGLLSKMLVFYAVFAIGLYAFGMETPFKALLAGEGDLLAKMGSTSSGFIYSLGAGVLAGIIASAIAGGAIGSYILFASFAALFLTFLTFPLSLTGVMGLPTEIEFLVKGIVLLMNILFSLALVSWLKGND